MTVTKDMVKNTPNIANDGHLEEYEQAALYDYYADYLGTAAGVTTAPTGSGQPPAGSDQAMTRSEEHLGVGTEKVEVGRARLRKYVVTENVTKTVPVSHEEVPIEHEPITDANVDAATQGPPITEAEHEVILHAERPPVVAKEAVPVERVRLNTEQSLKSRM